jgi:hypothetical protein
MPCEKNTQVAGTLIPQESRILHSNQHATGGISQIPPEATTEKSLNEKGGK